MIEEKIDVILITNILITKAIRITMRTLLLALLLTCAPVMGQLNFIPMEAASIIGDGPGCPEKYLSGQMSQDDGQVYIAGNVNHCNEHFAQISVDGELISDWFQPEPNNQEYDSKGNPVEGESSRNEVRGFGAGCVALHDGYSIKPSQAALQCGDYLIDVIDPEGVRLTPGQLGGWMTEIPPRLWDRLGGTHMMTRSFGSTREPSGSSMGAGVAVIDLRTLDLGALTVNGYILFRSNLRLITPPIDDQWPNVTRLDDRVSGGCTIVDDFIVCTERVRIGDWYGKNTYCQGSENWKQECDPGATPSIHPISGEPMISACLGNHQGRRQTRNQDYLRVYDLDGNEVQSYQWRDTTGCPLATAGIAFFEDERVLMVVDRGAGGDTLLHRWEIPPTHTPDPSSVTVVTECYPGDVVETYVNGTFDSEVTCQ